MIHEKIDEMIRERLSGGSGLSGLEDILLLQALTGVQGGQGLDLNSILPALIVAGGGFGRGGFGRGRAEKLALLALVTALQAQQAQTAGTISGGTQPASSNALPLLLAIGLLGEDRVSYLPRRVLRSETVEEEDVTKGEAEEEKEGPGGRRRRT
jgi:hypothetical protein